MANQHRPYTVINPCATLIDGTGDDVSGMFHLLTCGHIIAVDDENRRCGRNCAQAVMWAVTHAFISNTDKKTQVTSDQGSPPTAQPDAGS
ncbi:hypothetical protein SNOG_02481 [Parastagonospora nodorum SN15]|uniref:Uncharacterized protein n=1 Tax=Phaeosphaeria nodorum (strain SN15 / ATCC MYA-4574 / FGSC 10173) TaxID=321614 RepID=Q0V0I3_PHANO|nr:hypothetical protein SNOG_02481 [Parastagonospora nodorum SN15]EAT90693.1 hypothetical protein SNOG_02481 [Parastagonospora nodorum SN15]